GRRHTSCYRDWSSDVCSSDLDRPYHLRGCLERRRFLARPAVSTEPGRGTGRGGCESHFQRLGLAVAPGQKPDALRHVAPPGRQEIGRASCREGGRWCEAESG